MSTEPDFSPYRRVLFTVEHDPCGPPPDWTRPLTFRVTEVWGTSPRVAAGERYVVRGAYALEGDRAYALSLAVWRRGFGATAHLCPGEGLFETSTELLEVAPDWGNQIDVVVGRGEQCVMTARIVIAAP